VSRICILCFFFFQAEDAIRDRNVTGVQTCALPISDDVRDSPALDVATRLAGQGARVVVTDPIASDNASIVHPELTVKEDFNEALQGAEAVALLTEWPEYKELDPFQVAELVDVPYIFDGRNVLNPQRWRDAGWTFRGFGRP